MLEVNHAIMMYWSWLYDAISTFIPFFLLHHNIGSINLQCLRVITLISHKFCISTLVMKLELTTWMIYNHYLDDDTILDPIQQLELCVKSKVPKDQYKQHGPILVIMTQRLLIFNFHHIILFQHLFVSTS